MLSDIEKSIAELAQARLDNPQPKEEETNVNIINPSKRKLMLTIEYDQYQYKRIFWIAGYPKSGTTWVQLFLEAYLSQTPININNPYQHSQSDSQTRNYQAVTNQAINTIHDSTLYHLRGAALLHTITTADTDIVLKTHHANIGIDEGIPLIPSALTKQALYLVRDPRDTVTAFAHHHGLSIDDTITIFSDQNAHIARGNGHDEGHFICDWSTHAKSWTQTNTYNITIVKYEELITNPTKGFTKVLQALGRPIDQNHLTYALTQTQLPILQAQEKQNGYYQATNNNYFTQHDNWEQTLTKDQIHRIETAHRDIMNQLEYKHSI